MKDKKISLKDYVIAGCIGIIFVTGSYAITGAITGLVLGATLPALALGGIIGFVPMILPLALCIGKLLYDLHNNKKDVKEDKERLLFFSIGTLIVTAAGVGLAAVGFTSGAAIGAMLPIASVGVALVFLAAALLVALPVKAIKSCFTKEQSSKDPSLSVSDMEQQQQFQRNEQDSGLPEGSVNMDLSF